MPSTGDADASPADREESWLVAERSDLHRDDWVVALRADRVRRPGGEESPFRRLVLEHPGAAVVLALDDGGRVLCLQQYRHPVGRRLVELPAGLLDSAEDPAAVARRELAEEAGLAADDWRPLLVTYSSPGISTERMHVFLARRLRPARAEGFEPRHEEADMVARWVPFPALYRAVLDGAVTDGPLAQAVLACRARGWDTTPGSA